MLRAENHLPETFRFAEVVLPLNLPQTLTYGIPLEFQGQVKLGMRVEVNLGRNKQFAGVVVALHNHQPEEFRVKPIRAVIDQQEPIVNEIQLQFWDWIADYYLAAPGEVMQAALPAHLKLMGETRLVWNGEGKTFEWSDEGYLAAEALEMRKELTISELKAIVGGRHLNGVIQELILQEAVLINDALEPLYRPRKEKIVRLAPEYQAEEQLSGLFAELERAPRQLELLMSLVELSVRQGVVRQHDLLERSKATAAQVKALVDKGVLIVEERDIDRLLYDATEEIKKIQLTPVQAATYAQLEQQLAVHPVVLLEGVTGSGKTHLYIEKIRAVIAAGRQAILLLPEIGLTTQLVSRLYAYFGEELGVYHSRFSNNERVEIWEKVRRGTYKVVVGPRSALWLPYSRLGLIIVDEEHDGSYKQKDPAPRFHARDAAIYLARLHEAAVILGSATPSLETLYNVRRGKYGYAALRERYQGVQMPAIELISARSLEQSKVQGLRLLTPELQKAMLETLQQRKQVILFQNRRGYTPFQLCTVCGWVPQCKNCAVSLTYHKSTDKMHCHYCGLRTQAIHTCPGCGSNRIQSRTFGTERVEEEVRQVFPEVRIARMDLDSMRGKQSISELMDQLSKGKIDVLVGTQMVVKGLDFEKVGLVGVLNADSLLSFPDFRVNERAFQLMEQVSGRAGRSDGAGRVLIQAYNLRHQILHWVQLHDLESFFLHEITERERFFYPPFSRLIKVSFRHKDEVRALQAATELATQLQELKEIFVHGPAAALVARIRNQYIFEILIKCPRDTKVLKRTRQFLKVQRSLITGKKGNSGLQVIFDVDPV